MKYWNLKRRLAAAAALALTLAAGCATVSENTHAYLGSPQLAPGQPAGVKILSAEPPQPIIRLGEIILSVEGNPSRDRLEGKLRTAAARLGADGVYIASDRTQVYPYVYWDCWGPGQGEAWHRLVVGIAFKNK